MQYRSIVTNLALKGTVCILQNLCGHTSGNTLETCTLAEEKHTGWVTSVTGTMGRSHTHTAHARNQVKDVLHVGCHFYEAQNWESSWDVALPVIPALRRQEDEGQPGLYSETTKPKQ
jgi:hypothetical protein